MKFILGSAVAASLLALLYACGGGGGGGGAAGLSATQINFEASTLNDSYVRYSWSLPSTNVAPTPGTHYMFTDRFFLAASPSGGPRAETAVTENLASTLTLPPLTQLGVSRVLKSGVIYASNHESRAEWSYVGNDVVSTSYASDGITPLFATVYDSWSAPLPLAGQIGNTSVLKSFLGFTRLTAETLNFDFSKSWLAGSGYFTRKGYRKADTLFLFDWSGSSYTAAVTPYGGSESSIEGYFASTPVVTAGGLIVDSVVYTLGSGAITSIEGARAWVASAKRPGSASPTDEYVALLELNGKIYWGAYQKAGTRFKAVDGVDATLVNDYDIRLNATAAASMKQAIRF